MAQEFGTPVPPPPQRSNTPLIIAIIVAVLLCCCCVGGGLLAWIYGDAVYEQLFGPISALPLMLQALVI